MMGKVCREEALLITRLSEKGCGVGYVKERDGRLTAVEVPTVLPGETVFARLYGKRKGIYRGRLEKVIEASCDRIGHRCSHYGLCGGCRWQHLRYDRQLEFKRDFVREHFSIVYDDTEIDLSVIPCDSPWYYRNKMEFTFSVNGAGTRFLGLFIDGSKGCVFNMTECHLVHSWFSEVLEGVRQWWVESNIDAYHLSRDSGSLRTLILREGRRTGDRMVILTVSGNPDFTLTEEQLEAFVDVIQSAAGGDYGKLNIILRLQYVAKGVPTRFEERTLLGGDVICERLHLPGMRSLIFRIGPSVFFQPNTFQAEKLYSLALRYAAISGESVVFDLYCGSGTLALCAAQLAKEVIGIELSPESVACARANALENEISNVTFICGDVGKELQCLSKQPDVVMVDPPRAGLDARAIGCLIVLGAPRIIYISCNYMTQAANVKQLVAAGYRVENIVPVDQFPQTVHVENIVVLTRE